MTRITGSIRRLVRNEEAATMVEYALMVALIAVVALGAVQLLGGSVSTTFGTIQAAIAAA